jgi:hypothetical protein
MKNTNIGLLLILVLSGACIINHFKKDFVSDSLLIFIGINALYFKLKGIEENER